MSTISGKLNGTKYKQLLILHSVQSLDPYISDELFYT